MILFLLCAAQRSLRLCVIFSLSFFSLSFFPLSFSSQSLFASNTAIQLCSRVTMSSVLS
jgi:hypothetical protein